MCTLAWGQNDGQLWICFNRDEQHTRPEAESPVLRGEPGKRLAYARDPAGQGTWFLASERGFVVALLNHYPGKGGASGEPQKSRGQIVLELGRMDGLAEVEARLVNLTLADYQPFDLFCFSPDQVFTRVWDGSDLRSFACPLNFWTTSSHFQDRTRSWRNRWWQEQTRNRKLNVQSAGALMQTRCPDKPEFGITMDRTDAGTVSQIQLQMDRNGFVFAYLARSGMKGGYLPETVLRCPDQASFPAI